MAPPEQLAREIERLEGRLGATAVSDELATVRRGLASSETSGIQLPNLRLGFACKERWEDMVGDDRVRACNGCDRPVFNLSEMTREDAEAVLATRGLTPCVRFYRRPDGTVMTNDCPTGERRTQRRLAVMASSLAAGATLTAASTAMAQTPPSEESTPYDDPATPAEPTQIVIDQPMLMGIPVDNTFSVEMGVMIAVPEPRPAVEWSVWGRVGTGVATQQPDVIERRVTTSVVESVAASTWEAALGADLTFRVARHGDLRVGVWGEVRTSSDPVAGGELVLEGLPPHPYSSRIGGTGSLVLRAGANDRVVTGALGFGYVGSFPRFDPWVRWARHMVGARVIASFNRAIDDPHDWSATLGLEVEPIGAVHALLDRIKR